MSTVVLSAASPQRPGLQALSVVVLDALRRRGERQPEDLHLFELATTKLAYCQGEFDCWVKTPGVCRAHDAEAAIVQAVHDASRLVLLDATSFGGLSYSLKRAQDRLICLLSPFFEKRASLTHHEPRYATLPSLVSIGWTPAADPDLSQTWSDLADANALNMLSPHVGAILCDDGSRDGWPQRVAAALDSVRVPGADVGDRASLQQALMAAASPMSLASAACSPPRTAALVVGSAKPRHTSVSETLADALSVRLRHDGVEVETFFAIEFLHEAGAVEKAARIAAADLVVLVTPLYVDSLPALATHALECIAAARRTSTNPAGFALLVNCGFPEAEHNRTALRIGRHFAAQAGYTWRGGLPLGGGGALNPAAPLDAQHGPAEHVRQALDLAGPALAAGTGVPPTAIERMTHAPMPDVFYRVMGDLGWRLQAHRNRLPQSALHARPLD